MDHSEENLIINGTGHIAGRLASHVAKNLLTGKSIVILHCENITFSFPLDRARKIYDDYLRKKCLVNPRKGPYHYVEPSKYFLRMVKRMLPHKLKRGAEALKRLKCFDSTPKEFEETIKIVCPVSLLKFKANPARKSTTFGEILKDYGWKHYVAVCGNNKLLNEKEEKRRNEKEINDKKINILLKSEAFQREVEEELKRME